jgi:hypothetical protein
MRCDRFVRVALRFSGPGRPPGAPVDLERLIGISATACDREAVTQLGDEWLCVDHWIRSTAPDDAAADGTPEVHGVD